jgi:hypothetical protein
MKKTDKIENPSTGLDRTLKLSVPLWVLLAPMTLAQIVLGTMLIAGGAEGWLTALFALACYYSGLLWGGLSK